MALLGYSSAARWYEFDRLCQIALCTRFPKNLPIAVSRRQPFRVKIWGDPKHRIGVLAEATKKVGLRAFFPPLEDRGGQMLPRLRRVAIGSCRLEKEPLCVFPPPGGLTINSVGLLPQPDRPRLVRRLRGCPAQAIGVGFHLLCLGCNPLRRLDRRPADQHRAIGGDIASKGESQRDS